MKQPLTTIKHAGLAVLAAVLGMYGVTTMEAQAPYHTVLRAARVSWETDIGISLPGTRYGDGRGRIRPLRRAARA